MIRKRKPWREMTSDDVMELKKKQCVKCFYSDSNSSCNGGSDKTCGYILITGKRRGCDPRDCVAKGIFRPANGSKKKKRWKI